MALEVKRDLVLARFEMQPLKEPVEVVYGPGVIAVDEDLRTNGLWGRKFRAGLARDRLRNYSPRAGPSLGHDIAFDEAEEIVEPERFLDQCIGSQARTLARVELRSGHDNGGDGGQYRVI
jgi:hypothetical protein